MNKIKLIFSIIFLLLIGFCVLVSINNKKLKEQIDVSKHNINTLLLVNDTLKISNKSLLLDIYTLNNSNDSILKELNNVRNKLRIKDKEIESLHKINLEINKKDSVIIRDTNIFKNNNIHLDTTLTDKWGSTRIILEYPSSIKTEFKTFSDLSIYTYKRKEPIKEAKKCKLGRLLQRKVEVLEVEVVEKNPNIIIKQSKFIKVIE